MKRFYRDSKRPHEGGQVLPLVAILLVVMIIFVGMAIDFGFAYVTKARLSKAVDAACLTGIRDLSLGRTEAASVARNAFKLNYGSSGLEDNPPTVNLNFSTDDSNNAVLDVNATTRINTFFIRILPDWTTLNVRASAQATRAKLIMTLVLDRSGSMQNNNGWKDLPPAVKAFVDFFDDNEDRVGVASSASNATTDIAIDTHFKDSIKTEMDRWGKSKFDGGTFAHGGLTKAQIGNNGIATLPGENVLRVAVFFTDGLANIIQDRLNCNPVPTVFNFGGHDTGSLVELFDPTTGFAPPGGACSTNARTPPCCPDVDRFQSRAEDRAEPFNREHVTKEARYRAIQTANAMRNEGMVVYAIGLGNNVDADFLREVANDPASPAFNPDLPEGEAVIAPTSTDLEDVFGTIASKILLRLTQ